jgi:general secretion pathway protein A
LPALEIIIELTEIEINKQKVLQVILIGQTELQDKLKEKEFLFLAQKITVRNHLLPLTCLETSNYIQHRLNLVGSASRIFTENALNLIYKMSTGIPRLINILCNRCLLTAYTNNSQSVTSTMVQKAAKELQFTSPYKEKSHAISNLRLLLLIVLLGLCLFKAGSYFGYNVSFLTKVVTRLIGQTPQDKIVKSEVKTHITGFANYKNLDLSAVSFNDALTDLYGVWGYQINNKDKDNPCMQGKSIHLSCYTKLFTFDKLMHFNYPSVVKLTIKSRPVYVVLYKINDSKLQLLIKDQLITVSTSWFNGHWNGDATLLWQAPFLLKDDLKFGQQNQNIAWLAKNLSSAKDDKKIYKQNFDLTLLKQVKNFQRSHGLSANGVVGTEILMMLIPLLNPNIPRLMKKDH